MSNLARQELFFNRFFSIDEMVEGVDRVEAAEVQQLAQQFFSGRQIGATVLGRVNGIEFTPDQLRC
jgi:predicted Zn-dependent peptidase